jgi:alkylated DNA repair protein alkB family protein 8
MARRRVQHFGYDFIYGKNTINIENPSHFQIPSYCDTILEKIYKKINEIMLIDNIQFD